MSDWIRDLIKGPELSDGGSIELRGRRFVQSDGVLRDTRLASDNQAQTRDAFAFKWSKRDTYQSPAMRGAIGDWLKQRYGALLDHIRAAGGKLSLIDVGCGAGNAASLLFADHWRHLNYVGADISTAVDIASENIRKDTLNAFFVQSDLMDLPFDDGSFDIVFSEGVLHHTPSTRDAIRATSRLVRPGGLYAIYVYAKKSPAREFTDDHIRDLVSDLPAQQAWDALMPLTKLGKALGDLDQFIELDEAIPLLGIPAGRINVQRLFYWHFCKVFYRPDLTLDEMNHINFDWFMPKYCHRQTPAEVEEWCRDVGLTVLDLKAEEAGMTVLAQRPAS